MPLYTPEKPTRAGRPLPPGRRKLYPERVKLVIYLDLKERDRLYAFCETRASNPSRLGRALLLNYVTKNGG